MISKRSPPPGWPKRLILQFSYMKKCLSYNFHLWKNAYHTISYISIGPCKWKQLFCSLVLYLKLYFAVFWLVGSKSTEPCVCVMLKLNYLPDLFCLHSFTSASWKVAEFQFNIALNITSLNFRTPSFFNCLDLHSFVIFGRIDWMDPKDKKECSRNASFTRYLAYLASFKKWVKIRRLQFDVWAKCIIIKNQRLNFYVV